MNNKLPYKGIADQVASRGRYGDTTLMHVNPSEVQALSNVAPLTVNPDTGYPEAFLPAVLAPIIGGALAPMLLGGTALGATLGTAGLAGLGAGAASTLESGSIEEGMLTGLMTFAGANTFGDAAALTGAGEEATRLGLDASTGDLTSILSGGTEAGKTITELGKYSPEFLAQNAAGQNPTQFFNNNITSAADVARQSPFQNFDLGNFATAATDMKNIVPFASGAGGLAVKQDIDDFEKSNAMASQARIDKKNEILDSYTPSAPGMGGSVYTSRNTPGGTQSPFSVGGNNQYNKFDNFAYDGGRIENSYANGGQVERKMLGGDLRFSGIDFSGVDFGKYFDSQGNYIGNTTGGNTTGGNTTDGNATNNTITTQSAEDVTPTDPTMPDISNFSLGYDPTRINMTTGDYYTDEEMEGKIRGRGLTPVPYNYMPGFMPEYQYVSNIQPTSTIGGGDSSQQYEISGSGSMGLPNVVNIGGQNVYKGSYNPDLFAGGTPYNEYLLGNVEKGIPAYLSSYMQNTPYYQYQDQQLNSIFGGGGYGTPGFGSGNIGQPGQPVQPLPNPEDINPLQSEVDSLNKRVEDLLAEIDGKDSTIATELATDQGSTFTDVSIDPKSNLIVQTGDDAGRLNVDDNIFDYLTDEAKSKLGTPSNYLDDYLYKLDSFAGDTTLDKLTDFSGVNTDFINETTGSTDNNIRFDPNTGNLITIIPQADGTYTEFMVTTGQGYIPLRTATSLAEDGTLLNPVETTTEQQQASGISLENQNQTNTFNDPFELINNVPGLTQTESGLGGKTVYGAEENSDGTFTYTLRDQDGNFTNVNYDNKGNVLSYTGGRVGYASGGQILNSIKTLENYTQPLPTGGMEDNLYAVGGEIMQSSDTVEIDGQIIEKSDQVETVLSNPVIQEKMPKGDRELLEKMSYVILGRLKDDGSIMQEFIRLFGEEAYAKLKAELIPLPQQEGMIQGEGGGMDDKVNGVIGDQEQVAVSPGEYIVPADVVGNLGDGNSEEGARIMDDFLSRVRTEKHDTEKQPDPINLDNVMPA